MRKSQLLLPCVCLLIWLAFPAMAQERSGNTISLHLVVHNRPVKEVFHQIEKQARVTFHFDKTSIDLNKTVTLDLDKATLDEALDAVTKQTGYQFRQRGDKILIVGAGEVMPTAEAGEPAL